MQIEFYNQAFAPIFLIEAFLSITALLIVMIPRIKRRDKQCSEKMASHICWADVVLEFTITIQLIAGMFFSDKSPINVNLTIFVLYEILLSFSYLAFPYSFLWALVISHTAFKSADDSEYNIEQSYPKYVKIVVTISAIATVIELTILLSSSKLGITIIGAAWVIIFFTVIGMIIYNYIRTMKSLKSRGIPFSILLKQLWIFPGVLLICLLPIILINLVSIIYIFCQKQPLDQQQKSNLDLAQNIGNMFALLIGLFDAFAYGYNINQNRQALQQSEYLEVSIFRKFSLDYQGKENIN